MDSIPHTESLTMTMTMHQLCMALAKNEIQANEANNTQIHDKYTEDLDKTTCSLQDEVGCEQLRLNFGELNSEAQTCIIVKCIADKTGQRYRDVMSIFNNNEAFAEICLRVVKEHDSEVLLEMLSHDFDLLQVKDTNVNKTLLHLAAEAGNLDSVKFLLGNFDFDVGCTDKDGYTPLALALLHGQTAVAKFLIESGSDETVELNGKNSLLILAVNAGHVECVRLLLDHGVPVNAKNQFKQTAVTSACERGRVEILKMLISAGGVLDESDSFGYTPLMHAVIEGHIDVVRFLLQNGCNPLAGRRLAQDTSLHFAASYGHIKIVELLMEYIADPDVTDCIGLTPLYVAVEEGHLEVVKYLAPRCDLSKACHERGRPIDAAAEHGYLDALMALHEMGDDIYGRDSSGRTLLMKAAARGHLVIVRYLLTCDLPINATDNLDHSALFYSILSPNPQCVKFLLEAGARVDLVDYQGVSCLVKAIQVGQPHTVMLLILAGADIDLPVQVSHLPGTQSPLEVSVAESHAPITHLLITAGCTLNVLRSTFECTTRRSLLNRHHVTQESRIYIRDMVEQSGYEPHSMKVQCRKVLWRNFTSPAWLVVNRLPLPGYLTNYVLLKCHELLFDNAL